MIEKKIKLTISLPIQATITAHADVDFDFSPDDAIQAVKDAIRNESESLELLMLSESERQAREQEEDRIIEECLNGHR